MTAVSLPSIHILCAADRAFLRHVPVMLASVAANTTSPLRASIVSTNWKVGDQAKLRAATPGLDLNFIQIPIETVRDLPFKTMLSPLAYARILMPDLVDDDRFLYLDIDMIIRDDVAKLWAVDLKGAPAAAVFHNDNSALNSGLILVDAKVWRERRLGVAILEWARQHRPKEADQAAIEAVIGADILKLDPRWNRLVDPVWGKSMLTQIGYRENAAVLHFITGFKPWNFGRWLLPRDYAREWQKYVRKTGLSVDWRIELKTLVWQLRILLLK